VEKAIDAPPVVDDKAAAPVAPDPEEKQAEIDELRRRAFELELGIPIASIVYTERGWWPKKDWLIAIYLLVLFALSFGGGIMAGRAMITEHNVNERQEAHKMALHMVAEQGK
jgi:hypothetical protein